MGLLVDGGGALNVANRATSLAQEAARTAGQRLDPASAIEGPSRSPQTLPVAWGRPRTTSPPRAFGAVSRSPTAGRASPSRWTTITTLSSRSS
ncbi:hypothetical protein ACF08N_36455 [Streptomyces sp. NPDC015127]|uniref:hypothetical protein n=1 Tax=Streptomyces sp. NPDC015127 TaxID=3364939 RepID=UPI0036F67D3C